MIMTFGELYPGARIVLPSGRVVHVITTVLLGSDLLVRLRDDLGRTRDINVYPHEYAVLAAPTAEDVAVISLRERFPDIEFLRSI